MKQMLKQTLALLLSVVMLLSLCVTGASAEGITTVSALQAALDAASSDPVTLTGDVTVSETVALDLKGKTIQTAGFSIDIADGATLTVTDSVTGGMIENTVTEKAATPTGGNADPHQLFVVRAGGELIIEKGIYKTATYELLKIYGSATIQDGSFSSTAASSVTATYDGGAMMTVEGVGASLIMLDGSISVNQCSANDCGLYGVYALNGGTVTMGDAQAHTGPSIKTDYAVMGANNTTSPATFTVHGGTYESTFSSASYPKWCSVFYLAGDNTLTVTGGEFTQAAGCIFSVPYTKPTTSITVSGGTFTTKSGTELLYSEATAGVGSEGGKSYAISGGTFSDASVFDYLSDDASIKLGANMTLSSAIEFTSGTLTLDLNGMTVTSQGDDYIENNGATLTLKDSAGGGKLQATAADTGLIWNRKGTLNIQSGTYESTDYVLYIGATAETANNGTVNISGGTLTSSAGNTIDVLHNNILNITGGTLKATGTDCYVISSNNANSKVGNEVNISGTPTLESVQSTAVYHSQRGTLSISGGTIKGTTAVETKAGATTISGGSFFASINPPVYHTPNGNGTSTDGYAVALVENGGYLTEETVSVSITGGTFSGKVGKETDSEKAGTTYTLAISGGTFSADPTDYLDPAHETVASGTTYCVQPKTGNLSAAILHDNALTDPIADEALCDGTFTATPSVQNGVVEVNLRAANLKEHTNGSSTPGKWIGFALTAPANATQFKYAFNTTAEGLAALGELTAVEENVTADNQSGVAFYVDASDMSTAKTWAQVQWFDGGSNALTAPITYHMNIDISPIPSSSSSSSSSSGSSAPVQGATTVAAAGQTQTTATEAKLVVDNTKLDKAVTAAKEGASVVVTVPEGKAVASAQVALQSVESMAAKEMVLSVKVGNTSYEMPTAAVDTKAVLAQLGATETEADPVSVTISITKADATVQAEVEAAAAKAGAEIIGTPTAFEVTASFKDKSVSISRFDTYVQRVIEVTTEQSQKITTAIVHEDDGSLRHVPTRINQQDGKWFVTISSRTNSTYALIANKVSFADAQGTWYESFVNELASRKVIDGVTAERFDGDRDITRAEFTAILVRALGLPADGDASIFSDVPANAWYAGAVGTAYENGLVHGCGNGKFEPTYPMIRQDVMLMLRQAARLAEYPLDLLNARDLAKEFKDLDSVSDYAAEAMYWNLNNSFITGSYGRVQPQANVSRAECATAILHLLQEVGLIDE